MNYPDYSYPPVLIARIARDLILAHRRNFQDDAKACVEHLHPPLQVSGKENIPQHGPCVLTVNHYHRPGFRAQWITIAISAAIPIHVHWVMTGEFMYQGKWYRTIGSMVSRIFLKRVAHIYSFTTMPPMPPRPGDVEARAVSVRAVLEYVRSAKDPVLGLAPEGYDAPGGILTRPFPGVGRFALLLARAGLMFIPVGMYEDDGIFHLHFGEQYELKISPRLSADQKDECAIRMIMENIAGLLPRPLRGEFA